MCRVFPGKRFGATLSVPIPPDTARIVSIAALAPRVNSTVTIDPSKIEKLPLDPNLLVLKQDESEFFKALTGIQEDDDLKKHIIDVQTKAYETFCYLCIHGFSFTKLKISRLPAYKDVLKIRDRLPDAILLDAGCCFGNDLRKAVYDGWPVENAIASDLEADFWKYGHELFKTSQETFPAGFVAGDIFSPEITQPREPFYAPPPAPRPENLQALKSLTPLQGHISAIHASSLFHLFDEEKQAILAQRLASLLAPEPGSIIFGSHCGLPQKGTYGLIGYPMFCHSPESWSELWDGQIFKKGTVRVEAQLADAKRPELDRDGSKPLLLLIWSVTRL